MSTRRYTQKKRAAQQAATRDKIVRATMALHEERGPRDTTVSAIAARAGVQRLTVYRHFPDDQALFQACTTRWLELNPPPDAADWAGSADPRARAQAALLAFYRYYRSGQRMWSRAYRDRAEVPALQAPMAAFEGLLTQVRDDLAAAWAGAQPPATGLLATLALGLRFQTWQVLAAQGLADAQMAELASGWAAASVASDLSPPAT